jgi:cell division protein FtsN
MRKTGIVLIVLLVAVSIAFLSLIPSKKAKVEPIKITKKIPAPEFGKTSKKEEAVKESLELDTPDKIHAENTSAATQAPESGVASEETTAKPSPEPTLPDKIHASDQMYSIQIASFKDFRTAVRRSIQLKSLGHNSFYTCERLKGNKKLYRVYLELYNTEEEAEKKALQLKQTGLVSKSIIKSLDKTVLAEAGDCKPGATVFFLHVSSYKQKKSAEEESQRLKAYGHNIFTISEDINGASWFRIYIGDFDNEKNARKFGSELQAKGLCSYFKPVAIDNIIQPPRHFASMPVSKSTSIARAKESSPPPADESKSIQPQAKQQAKSEPALVIHDITFKVQKGIREIVFLHANRYFSPSVFFNLEGEKPKITIELDPPATVKNVQSNIAVKGNWIKQIQIQGDHDNKTVRIVVNLVASEKYKVSQSYYESGHVYAIKVMSEENPKPQ